MCLSSKNKNKTNYIVESGLNAKEIEMGTTAKNHQLPLGFFDFSLPFPKGANLYINLRYILKTFLCTTLVFEWPPAGADLEGGAPGSRPVYFFAQIRRLTSCGCPRQKECTKSNELTLKIAIFLCF